MKVKKNNENDDDKEKKTMKKIQQSIEERNGETEE